MKYRWCDIVNMIIQVMPLYRENSEENFENIIKIMELYLTDEEKLAIIGKEIEEKE